MAASEVGVLEIQVKSDASTAAEGLNQLADALTSVKGSLGNGLNLAGIAGPLNKFAKTVADNSKTLSNIGTFLNSITNYSKAFKEMENIKFNSKPIDDLKAAIGDGIKIGQAGTQIGKLREALGGDWNTDNATKAGAAIEAIANSAKSMQGSNLGTIAKNVGLLAKALDESATSAEKLRSAIGESAWNGSNGTTADIKEQSKENGTGAADGLAEGMTNGAGKVDAAGKELARIAINSTKEKLDEHSHSKEFKIIGEYIVEGMIEGILSKKTEIESVMADLAKGLIGTTKESVGNSGDWRGAMMGIGGETKSKGKQSGGGIAGSLKKLTDALQGAGKFSEYAQGLTEISAAIESGAKSYLTLGRLATSMEKVKAASQGFKLPNFSKLESLARTLQENFNAENGLNRLAEGMAAIDAASKNFKMPSMKDIEKIISIMNGTLPNTGKASGTVGTEDQFSTAASTVQEVVTDSMDLITTNTGLAATQMQEQFDESFGSIASDAKNAAHDTVKNLTTPVTDIVPAGQATDSRVSFDNLREGAIEVEGTVSDSTTSIAGYIEGTVQNVSDASNAVRGYLTGVIEEMKKVEQEAENVQEKVRPEGYGTVGSIREIYASTTGYGPALRGKLGQNEKYKAVKEVAEGTGMSEAQIVKQLVQLGEEARKARAQVDELMGSLNKPLDWTNLSQGIDRMQGIGAEVKSAEDSMRAFLEGMGGNEQTAQNLREANPGLNQFKQEMEDAGIQAKDFTSSLVDVDGELKAKKKDTAEATRGFKGLKETFKNLVKTFKTTVFGKLADQFGRMAKRMAIRAIIKQVSAAFKEGVENVYRYNQAIGGTFASDMDSAATSLLQLKNSIGAAIAPVIQAAIPYLQQLINVIIEGINYVNQFFALLNGQNTWTRAVPYATQAFEDQKRSARGASKAMKDLLADWDELNIIQSQGNDGSSGNSGKKPENHAAMFEQVSQFDSKVKEIAGIVLDVIAFVKEHWAELLASFKLFKWALKGLKFSKAFTGVVNSLLKFAAGALIIDLALKITSMFDDKYIATGNAGWLLGDVLTTALGAGLAAKVMPQILGKGTGLITAGLTFAFSAGATFAKAANVEDVAKSSTLNVTGMAKLGFGAILAAAGIHAAGLGVVASATGGILITGVAATIKYLVDMDAEQKRSATAAAKAAFSGADDKSASIKPDEYIAALQKELDKRTENAKLVLNVYTEVPDLKGKYDEAVAQLQGLSAVIAGSDSLSQDDAEAFKETWTTVMDTLDDMNKKTYNTLLQGLNIALGKAVGEAKEKILELRKEFVKLNEGLNDRDASLYTEMEDIIEKLTSGKFEDDKEKEAMMERYTQLAGYFADMDSYEVFKDLNEQIEKGATLDFSQGEDSVEEARKYIQEVQAKVDETNKTFDDAENALKDSYAHQMQRLERLYEQKLIDESEYNKGKTILEQVLEKSLEPIQADRAAAAKKIDEAYNLLFETIMSRHTGTTAYWKEIVLPLMEDAKKAGATIPEEVATAFQKAISGQLVEFNDVKKPFAELVEKTVGFEPSEIADEINKWITKEIKDGGLLNNFEPTKTKVNEIVDISQTLGFTGFDLLTKDLKKRTANAIREAYGDNGEEILKLLGYDFGLDTETLLSDIIGITPEEFMSMSQDMKDYYAKKLVDAIGEEGAAKYFKDLDYKYEPIELPPIDFKKFTESLISAYEQYKYYLSLMQQKVNTPPEMPPVQLSVGYGGGVNRLVPKAMGGPVRSGDLVLANENGQFEMMGRMGNQPVVANNQQIISGISQGVAQANGNMESRLSTIETLLQRILQKEFVAKAVPGSNWGDHNRKSGAALERVTG